MKEDKVWTEDEEFIKFAAYYYDHTLCFYWKRRIMVYNPGRDKTMYLKYNGEHYEYMTPNGLPRRR